MRSNRFAAKTTVPSEKSRMEIERNLKRYGASSFGYIQKGDSAMIAFEFKNMSVRMKLPLPKQTDEEFRFDHAGRQRRCSFNVEAAVEQATRQRWRALNAVVLSKLEAVEAGISTMEEEFLAYLMLPSGCTMAEEILPELDKKLAEMRRTGKTISLLTTSL